MAKSRILTVIGARPQFIKASVVSRLIADEADLQEIIVHTGQHFDDNMSEIFFSQLGIPRPDYGLNIHGGRHGEMTGRMLMSLEEVMVAERPDRVLVYGDTNSTLAGALAAAKLHVPVAHIEAGLRSLNMRMPEEINRILTDQLSDILFCPTQTAVENLRREGFDQKPVEVNLCGDVMQDSAVLFEKAARRPDDLTISSGFILATLHRAENTDDPQRLAAIVSALNELQSQYPVVLPLHPRTRRAIEQRGLDLEVNVIDPVGYLEMLWLLDNCGLVVTDSGGVQKEAFFFGKGCVTTRDQTEWVELVQIGANCLVGADPEKIVSEAVARYGKYFPDDNALYGGGCAARNIVARLR